MRPLLLVAVLLNLGCVSAFKYQNSTPDKSNIQAYQPMKWAEEQMAKDPEMGAKFKNAVSDDVILVEFFDQKNRKIGTAKAQ